MLLPIFEWLSQFHSAFNVFQYSTFRTILAVLTALGIALIMGPRMIRALINLKMGQPIRDDGPQTHFSQSRHANHGRCTDFIRYKRSNVVLV